MIKDPFILQYEAWQNIIHSPDWKYFGGLVKEHIDFLNDQTCIAVRNGKCDEAMKYQAKADDWKKVISSIDARLKELEGNIKTEEGG